MQRLWQNKKYIAIAGVGAVIVMVVAGIVAAFMFTGNTSPDYDDLSKEKQQTYRARHAFGGVISKLSENSLTVTHKGSNREETFTIEEDTEINLASSYESVERNDLQEGATVNVMYHPDSKEATNIWLSE